MDPISDLLRGLRLTGGIFLDVRLTAPWSILSNISAANLAAFMPRADHVIGYHVVTAGEARLKVTGAEPIMVKPGEVVLLPQGGAHWLASGAGLEPINAATLIRRMPDGRLARIDHGGGGAVTRLYCGFLGADGGSNPLLAGLQPVLKIDARAFSAREWIEASVRFAAAGLAEGLLPATDIVSRLSETLLIEAVRQYVTDHPALAAGWLAGARDAQIGRALALIHADIGAPLTVERLAAEAALSRSAFVARFQQYMGTPPMRYLALRRLDAGRARLAETGDTIASVAWDLGYGSEEAFSRAFRREYGLPPGRWRETARGAACGRGVMDISPENRAGVP
jgi:AraC-like DNA-binding protein